MRSVSLGILPEEETGDGAFKCVVVNTNPCMDFTNVTFKPLFHDGGHFPLTLGTGTALTNDNTKENLLFGQLVRAVDGIFEH